MVLFLGWRSVERVIFHLQKFDWKKLYLQKDLGIWYKAAIYFETSKTAKF